MLDGRQIFVKGGPFGGGQPQNWHGRAAKKGSAERVQQKDKAPLTARRRQLDEAVMAVQYFAHCAAHQGGADCCKDVPVPSVSTLRLPARHADARLIAMMALLFGTFAATPVQAADPKAAFSARCGMCHQATGAGLAGQFPRLSGRAAAIAQAPEGRRYLAKVVLHGQAGPIEVDGTRISGVMPGMSSVSDAEIAEILSYALTLGNPAKAAKPFKAAEVAAVRAEGRASMADNNALRARLVNEGVIK